MKLVWRAARPAQQQAAACKQRWRRRSSAACPAVSLQLQQRLPTSLSHLRTRTPPRAEHAFEPGSPQHAWFEATLRAVDRTRTPWLVVGGHRPIYIDSTWWGR